MRVLLVDAFQPDDPDRRAAAAAVETLQAAGHLIDRLDVHDFEAVMSASERRAYHSDNPIVSDDVADSAERVRQAEALLFCYPSLAFAVPAVLKGWLERVMVPGVAFVFDDKHRVSPGMPNVKRVGAITTSTHSRIRRIRARDAGKRTTARTLRLSCHKRCRTTFLTLKSPTDAVTTAQHVAKALRRWR